MIDAAVLRAVKSILAEIDHAVLAYGGQLIRVMRREKKSKSASTSAWVSAVEECKLLPSPNTTVELMANYHAEQLERLSEQGAAAVGVAAG